MTGTRFQLHTPLFHATHIVASMDEALGVYQRLFARPILHAGYWDLGHRWAIFVYVGDVWLEAAIPDSHPSGLRKFVDRFGSRLHSLAWYVDGIDELVAVLRGDDRRIAEDPDPKVAYSSFAASGSGSRPVPRHGPIPLPPGYRRSYPDGWDSRVVYTHFRDTFGMLEFCEPSGYHAIPPRTPDPDMLPVDDPLGIIRASHHTIVVEDGAAASAFWVERLGAQIAGRRTNDLIGSKSTFVRVGNGPGTLLELAEAQRPGSARADLDACGLPILHSITFSVSDLAGVRDHLASAGVAVEADDDDTLVTDPGSSAGARYGFTVATAGW
jgi:catechol 2,3-dioxygenase-like lactoylglutathione lyase family enzyme